MCSYPEYVEEPVLTHPELYIVKVGPVDAKRDDIHIVHIRAF